MQLTVLADNNTTIDRYLIGEPAVSYYIRDTDISLLVDVGYSDVFMKNAAALGIDIGGVDTIVLSHGHDDHTGGLVPFFAGKDRSAVRIIAHPLALSQRDAEGLAICAQYNAEMLEQKCRLTLSDRPIKLSGNLTFLGEIPQMVDFEPRDAIGEMRTDNGATEDFVMDDSAVVYRGEDGLFLITGCSHSGICNIAEYAKLVCKDERIAGIIGGFHLFDTGSRLEQTIAYFKENRITQLYPCHCTSFAVRAEINKQIPITEVGVGMKLTIL